MKISYSWLKEILAFENTPEEIGQILTSTGLEVESIEKFETIKGGLEGVIIGQVLEVVKHPDADRLKITTVDIGLNETLQIVCGAPNVEANQKVLVATVGSTIYPTGASEELKIKKSKIRGIESNGMICAEDELGLGESHEGILILPDLANVGTHAADYFKISTDYIFEIGLTPNRSDAMSHVGVARDIKAYLNIHQNKNLKLKLPVLDTFSNTAIDNNFKIKIHDSNLCKRYAGAIIENIRVTESPDWLKNRLKSIGLRPINNVVDITNFVMYEMGNPLHAFDLNVVGHEINIRRAKENEKITTLDDAERNLNEADLMICNQTETMCIAGVMGGLHSGVKNNTTSIFLETAVFDTTSIRKTVKRHVLNSDSSFRFERGVDIDNIIDARNRAIELILNLTGGTLKSLFDIYPSLVMRKEIKFSFEKCNKLIGNKIDNDKIISILRELEYECSTISNESATIQVPNYRYDVERQADLTEEVLRIYGFNAVNLPEKLNTSVNYSVKPNSEKIQTILGELLVSSGYYEIWNNSLESENLTSFNSNGEPIKILNPLSNELSVLRSSMIFGGLNTIQHNQNRQNPDLKLFEFGKVYAQKGDNYFEEKKLALFISGNELAESWNSENKSSNFYSLKKIVNKILTRFGISELNIKAIENKHFEDGLGYEIRNKLFVEFGWISENITNQFGIKNKVYYADFNLDLLIKMASEVKTEFKSLPKTQFVRRDFSLLLNNSVKFEEIKNIAEKTAKKLLQSVNLFDVYEGKNLPEGKKSYAVSFTFQDHEKTLQDKQVDDFMSAIRKELESQLNAELR